MSTRKVYVFVISLLLLNTQISGDWSSWFEYIWPNKNVRLFDGNLQSLPKVPFEVGDRDEKFIIEASKALGSKLTDLDFCQQKIMLSLRSSCSSLTDEQVGKLAILLMNCQLHVEGHKGFECTENMSLNECTSSLTDDARLLYYNLQNRAKTLCLIIRQQLFRGLAEITVNNLMKSAQENVELMNELKKRQEELQQNAIVAIEEVTDSNSKLLEKQHDLLKITESQRINSIRNLQTTLRERDLLKTGHAEMSTLISKLKLQIHNSLSSFQEQSIEARTVYNGLLGDISELQEATEKIAIRLDEASGLILEHSKLTKNELEATVAQLREVNDIVLSLSSFVKEFQTEYNDKMTWLRQLVGGSEENLIRHITVAVVHIVYLLVGMLCLIFINADAISRILFLSVVCLNFVAVMYDVIQLDIATLSQTTAIILGTKYLFTILQKYDLKKIFEMGRSTLVSDKLAARSSDSSLIRRNHLSDVRTTHSETTTSRTVYQVNDRNNGDLGQDGSISARIRKQYFNERRAGTPISYTQLTNGEDRLSDRSRSSTPFSTQSSVGSRCIAQTARGTQCQLTAISGSYCRIHEKPSLTDQPVVK